MLSLVKHGKSFKTSGPDYIFNTRRYLEISVFEISRADNE